MIGYEHRNAVVTVTLATSAIDNSLDVEAATQLEECIRRADADPDCRAVVIQSAGPKFCTGMNLTSAACADKAVSQHGAGAFASALLGICQSSKPLVAFVEGDVTAGGLGLMAACDIVIAARTVRVSLSEAIVGMVPMIVSPFLKRRMTPAAFGYLALSTKPLTADEAQSRGLIDEVCDPESRTAMNRQLDRLLHCSPASLARIKRLAVPADLGAQVESAVREFCEWIEQPDVRAALRDFANGLAPSWFRKYKG